MRTGISIIVSAGARRRLEAIVSGYSVAQKHAWRARIVLLTADGLGTAAIMRETGRSEPFVWRWQERFMAEGIYGLLREMTRPSDKAPVPPETVNEVVRLTREPPPPETTHWTDQAMAKQDGLVV